MDSSIITLTTDFGLRDPYVAEMKAVIAGISPNTLVIDISHEIEKFSIKMGAFVIAEAAPYFPKDTIHLAVVDPGVGGQRKPIVIQTKAALFVGPDNGLMMLAAGSQGILSIHEIANPRFISRKVSNTFHGRDVFAPTAANLSKGLVSLQEIGPELSHAVQLGFAEIRKRGDVFLSEVVYVDGFGNVITNINQKDLYGVKPGVFVEMETESGRKKFRFCRAYEEAADGEIVALVGSHNYLEIAVNQGNASFKLGLKVGHKIALRFCS